MALVNYLPRITLANFSTKGYHQTKLARRSAALTPVQGAADYENEEELDLDLPYGIQNVRKRMARHKPDHTKSVVVLNTKKTKAKTKLSAYTFHSRSLISRYVPQNASQYRWRLPVTNIAPANT